MFRVRLFVQRIKGEKPSPGLRRVVETLERQAGNQSGATEKKKRRVGAVPQVVA